MSISVIRTELQKRLAAWAAAQTPPLPIALEGVPFNKPVDKSPFVEVFFLPGITINPTVDAKRKREIGIMQVNIWVLDGKGTGQIESLADSLVSAFPIIPKIGGVSVERTPSIAQPILEAGYRVLPVSIQYRLDGPV